MIRMSMKKRVLCRLEISFETSTVLNNTTDLLVCVESELNESWRDACTVHAH